MKLEQVLPQLRDGQTITRSRPFDKSATVIFVKIEESRLKFNCIWHNGEQMEYWAYYNLRTEDIMAEDWEVAG
jgi:hypothetical protein